MFLRRPNLFCVTNPRKMGAKRVGVEISGLVNMAEIGMKTKLKVTKSFRRKALTSVVKQVIKKSKARSKEKMPPLWNDITM